MLCRRLLILSLIVLTRCQELLLGRKPRDANRTRVMALHVAHQFLSSLEVDLQDLINLGLKVVIRILIVWGSFYNGLRVYLDLFFVNVLLEPALVIIPVMEVIIASNPLMLFLLFLNIFLCLMHVA